MMLKKILFICCIVTAGVIGLANQWHDDADRYWNEAQRFKRELNYREAIQSLRRAVMAEKRNEHPRPDELIAQFNELGLLYGILGDFEKSLHYHRMTLNAAEKYRKNGEAVLALINMGGAYRSMGRSDEAMDAYARALGGSKSNGFRDKEMRALNEMGGALREAGNYDDAMKRYHEALDAAKAAGGGVHAAAIINNIGTLHYIRGEFDEALESYGKALDLDKSRGDEEALSIGMSNTGNVYAAIGSYGEALNYFEKALEIDTRLKNDVRIAARLNRIGDIYFRVGDTGNAISNFTRSLEMNKRIDNSLNVAVIHAHLGRVYESMGRHEEALDQYMRALTLNRELEKQEHLAARFTDIGLLYETRERHGEAADYLVKALGRDMKMARREKVAENMSNIGRVMISMKRFDEALDYFRRAMEISRETGDILATADDLKNCGIVQYHRKEWSAAVDHLLKAKSALDGMRGELDRERDEVRADIYRWLVAVYVISDRPEKAFEANEEYCVDRLYSPGAAWRPPTARRTGDLRETLLRRLGRNGAAVVYSNVAWDDPQVIYIDGSSSSGHVIDKAATVKEIYNRLGREIERFMGEKKTDIIFSVGQKSRRDYYSIEFEKIINYYRHLASKKYVTAEEKGSLRLIGRALYDLLLGKVAGDMEQKSELLIQTDGVLSTLPIETLVMPDGRYLVEKYGVSYVHSHGISAAASRRTPGRERTPLFLMGGALPPEPPEPRTVESVRHFDLVRRGAVESIVRGRSLRGIYGFFGVESFGGAGEGKGELDALGEAWANSGRLVGSDLTEDGLTASSRTGVLARYRIVHIASRALVVPEVPVMSALVVAPKGTGSEDGLVNFREITSLKADADLVMLANTCITPARFSRGEGVWSLCGAFIDSGARNVALSIWPVEDSVKSAFLKRVYRYALDKGVPLGEAFTRTKREFILKTIDTGRGEAPGVYSSPYFWGSFMIYGY